MLKGLKRSNSSVEYSTMPMQISGGSNKFNEKFDRLKHNINNNNKVNDEDLDRLERNLYESIKLRQNAIDYENNEE